jgi:AP-2 complex subunit alpha
MALSISGLSLFISDIRACANEEEELEVVELQKQEIRKILSSKDDIKSSVKKACIWKLVYIKLLGHDVTFCIEKAPELIASENLSEKYTGYIATSLLIGEKHVGIYEEITPLVSNDLYSSN